MPTYEYACRDCGHSFEIVRSMLDEPLTMCPECGGSLRKVFAPPAISFKGSGFYATDHGKKAKKPGEPTRPDRKDDGLREKAGDEAASTVPKDASKASATETSSKKERAAS